MNTTSKVTTLITLANANELVSNVVLAVVGNEISDTINGAPLTKDAIHAMVQSHIQLSVNKYIGAK